jgi:hypothetical protein
VVPVVSNDDPIRSEAGHHASIYGEDIQRSVTWFTPARKFLNLRLRSQAALDRTAIILISVALPGGITKRIKSSARANNRDRLVTRKLPQWVRLCRFGSDGGNRFLLQPDQRCANAE